MDLHGVWHVSRPVATVMVLAVLLGACGEENRGFGETASRIPDVATRAPQGMEGRGPPATTCIDSVAGYGRFRETAGLLPEDLRDRPREHEVGWAPTLVSDVVVRDDRILVADELGAAVYSFSTSLRERKQLLREGRGPREVLRPTAIAAGPADGEFSVADRGLTQVKVFGIDGEFRRSHDLPHAPVDLAIADDGAIYVSHMIFVAPEFEGRTQTAVSVLSAGEEEFRPFVTMPGDSLTAPRFMVRGPTAVRVAVGGGRVAVWFPVSGTIDVYSAGGERLSRIRSCLPPEIARFYETQWRSSDNSSFTFDLVTDVRFSGRGDLRVVGTKPDDRGRYHVARYLVDGGGAGSLVDPTPGIQLPEELRFGDGDLDFVGFTREGIVGTLTLEPEP